jgi:glycosyltransferase involved in cell wall biosynthesis
MSVQAELERDRAGASYRGGVASRMGEVPAGRPIKVLFVQDHLARPGEGSHGVTSYLRTVLPALRARRLVEPSLCVLSGPRGLQADDRELRPVFLGREKWDPRSFQDLRRLVHDQAPDILHLSAFKSLLLGRVIGRMTGRPVVAHLHDAYVMSPGLAKAQRLLAPWTDAAVAVSDAVAEVGRCEYGLKPEQIRVLHNGVPRAGFAGRDAACRTRVRGDLGLPPDAPVLAVIGRLVEEKGQADVLQAMPAILRNVPAARALVVGSGPLLEPLKRLARELGVTEAVHFAGYRSDVPAILAAVDLAIVPSQMPEGLGFGAVEACCAGVPVVAYRTGGLPEVVEDGVNGFLVEVGDVNGLAEATSRVLADEGLRKRLAAGALTRRERFSLERHVARLEELYLDVLRRSADGRAHA